MVNLIKSNYMFGYIEGYYGKLLNWEERNKIVKKLKNLNMKYYFYAPKEDVFHRALWRKKYPDEWVKKFNIFTKFSHQNGIKLIAGVSPGLDFNYSSILNPNENTESQSNDFKKLIEKCFFFQKQGVKFITLLFDDIPASFSQNYKKYSEGATHALLANKLSSQLKKPVLVVPRVYADELAFDSPNYLNDFFDTLSYDIKVFYTGKNIVSKNVKSDLKIISSMLKNNRIVFWDNFHANDYCPKKIFLGTRSKYDLENGIMANLTGMPYTDMLILDIISISTNGKNSIKNIKEIFCKNKIPKKFFKIYPFFKNPVISKEKKTKKDKLDLSHINLISCLDYLLWKWKHPLSIEWYSHLINLKHDLQILNDQLTSERIAKTQTYPMQKKLIYNGEFR